MGPRGSSSTPVSPTCSGTPGLGPCRFHGVHRLLRNDGRPGLTTWILRGGASTCCLDYPLDGGDPLGDWRGGHRHHALPGGDRRLLSVALLHPRSQLRIRLDTLVPDWRLMGRRCDSGSSLMYLYLSVVLALVTTRRCCQSAPPRHAAAYGVITARFFYLIFEGIAMGIQPIASFNAGAGNCPVPRVRNLALG